MVELLLRTEKGERVAVRLAQDRGPFLAPHLVDLEVLQALRGILRTGRIGLAQADAMLAAFAQFPLQRLPHDVLRPRVWELRENLTVYDASYVVIAELLGRPLVTCDGPLSRAPGHGAMIELV